MKPDLLILQFCTNDFNDNHLAWQSNAILPQLYLRRPFINLNGDIEFTQGMMANLYYSYAFQNSRILNVIDTYINILEFMYFGGYSSKINPEQENYMNLNRLNLLKKY